MINREDMLELTRRMTPARTSFTRIAGCYVDADGDFDGSFNINFLKLSPSEKTKNLAIAKTIPFAETNTKLKTYEIQPENPKRCSLTSSAPSVPLSANTKPDPQHPASSSPPLQTAAVT